MVESQHYQIEQFVASSVSKANGLAQKARVQLAIFVNQSSFTHTMVLGQQGIKESFSRRNKMHLG